MSPIGSIGPGHPCELGMGVVVFDYRGFGLSQGKPHGEKDLQADGQAFLDELAARVPSSRIIVFGESLGGGVACDLAAGQKVGGLVLLATFANFTAQGSGNLFPSPVAWLSRYRFDSLSAVSRIDCPKLIMHSPKDEVNRYEDGQALYKAAKGPCQSVNMKGSHGTPDMHLLREP